MLRLARGERQPGESVSWTPGWIEVAHARVFLNAIIDCCTRELVGWTWPSPGAVKASCRHRARHPTGRVLPLKPGLGARRGAVASFAICARYEFGPLVVAPEGAKPGDFMNEGAGAPCTTRTILEA